ncbi:MAG: phage terminase small subunit [Porticoccaceae bacterium]
MATPAQRHFQRAMAATAAGAAPAGAPQTGDQYELMAAALWEARRTLKAIKSVEAKVEKKRQLLPQFAPYTQGVLAKGNGAQDDVLMTCMVWHFDIGDLDSGLEIAEYALRHGLNTPDHYERDTASLVAEQVADEALKLIDVDGTNLESLLGTLHRAYALTEGADMHDQIRAKLHKAMGYAWRAVGEPQAALDNLNRALVLNDRVGVKKDIEKLERELKNAGGQDNN